MGFEPTAPKRGYCSSSAARYDHFDITPYCVFISRLQNSESIANTGRPRGCPLTSYISALLLQKIFTIPTDSLLILILNFSSELRSFCGITKVPDASIRKMYSNGHFCYGRKFGIITNGLGIPRHIDFFDDDFKLKHKDFIFEDIDSPE